MSPEILKKALAVSKEQDGAAALALIEEMIVEYASGAPAEPAPGDPTAASAEPDPEAEAMTALARDVVALSGAKTAGEAATRTREVYAAHAETEKRSRDLEASERRGLVADLVKIGAETPATAWQSVDAEGDARQPVKRLADEPIAELRSRVKALAESRGVVLRHRAPEREPEGAPAARPLSREAKEYCKKHNITEAEFRSRRVSAVRRST